MSVASTIFAYIDPASGGLILNLIITVLAGVGIYFRRTWLKLLGFVKPKKCEEPQENPADDS